MAPLHRPAWLLLLFCFPLLSVTVEGAKLKTVKVTVRADSDHPNYEAYRAKGVEFVRDPKVEDYGTVAVFKDLYGNMWDLLELTEEVRRERGQ